MMENFTNLAINPTKMYGGANGNKIGIVYKNETYMLKFPPKAKKNPALNYSNSCMSEYVACHIFEALGFETQETVLGLYNDKVTVACKDFEVNGFLLKDFAHLKNTILDSEQNGYGTELTDILNTIQEQRLLPPDRLKAFFWKMFIGDALLGNFDRHNGNWGFLVNATTGEAKIAPIFDCGSCLYPQLDDDKMAFVLRSEEELTTRIFVFPTSSVQLDNKKINYAQFLMETDNEDCLRALADLSGKIDMQKIKAIIEDTPSITATQKKFFTKIIEVRKELILDRALAHHRSAAMTSKRGLPPYQ
ncbi:MAG: HipA domain-containing protein [Clostridiales bacterium]|jgi:hypothetical protein|nr:HipA domain-containing protein [Clostridiales bacterium]